MDSNAPDERIHVKVADGTLGVVVTLGDVQVTVTLPAPSGTEDMGAGPARALALRHARRALEVAREELE